MISTDDKVTGVLLILYVCFYRLKTNKLLKEMINFNKKSVKIKM